MTMIAPEAPKTVSSGNWNAVLGPYGSWTRAFDTWISNLAGFRKWELETFFRNTSDAEPRSVHRGFASSLIDEGEQLLLALRALEQTPEVQKSARALKAFLANLQSTVVTWHTDAEDFQEVAA